MAWGTSFGTGWGGGSTSGSGFWVERAYASSSQSFIVVFSARPTFNSPIGPTDASNLSNFVLTNLDTAEVVALLASRAVPSTVLAVEFVMTQPFTSSFTGYQVIAANLVGYLGEPFVEPKYGNFLGMPSVQTPIVARRPLLDLFNPQVEGDQLNGGLVIGTDGDYRKESGAQLMRKLIVRRIVTAQAEFFHLADVRYGQGITAKNTPTTTDLIGFQKKLSDGVSREPELENVAVRVSLSADHVMIVGVSAHLRRTGQRVELSIPLPSTVVQ